MPLRGARRVSDWIAYMPCDKICLESGSNRMIAATEAGMEPGNPPWMVERLQYLANNVLLVSDPEPE